MNLYIYQIIMQKQDKPANSVHHKCQMCSRQPSTDCLLTDVAHYCAQTGKLNMVTRLACKPCRQQITTIRQYVEENSLSFSKNSSLFKQFIEPYLPQDNNIRMLEESQIYQKTIQQQIKRNKLYHCAHLPQNCLQLVYYSSFSVNHAERHERIRNTISEVMRVAPIPYGNLDDIAILVHCLSCFMHQSNVITLLKTICQKNIIQGPPINPSHVDAQIPTQRIWKQLYLNMYIGNIVMIIGQLLKDWRNFDSVSLKLKQYNGYLKKQKISHILSNGELSSPTSKKKAFHQAPSKQHDLINSNCKQCVKNRFQFLMNQAKMKNLFSLSLRCLIRQDAAQREHVKQIQVKFLKQKQQFINKIIKLKDKIQVLQHQDEQNVSTMRRTRSVSQYNIKKNYKPDLQQVQQKSQGTIKTQQNKQKNDQNVKTFQTQKFKQQQGANLEFLHKLVINIPDFDPSLLANDVDEKSLMSTIQNSIKNMKQQLQKLQKKNRLLENQSKRLLTILTRKQERFVPLIHEKDQIIQRYQNALWKMQHGLPVEDPALAPRIVSIMNTFKNQFLQNLSTGTMQSDLAVQDPKQKSAKKKDKQKQKNKIKQKTSKNLQKNQKQCVIF